MCYFLFCQSHIITFQQTCLSSCVSEFTVSITGLPFRLTEVQKMSDCVEEEEVGAQSQSSSYVSMKSDQSDEKCPDFKNEPGSSDIK